MAEENKYQEALEKKLDTLLDGYKGTPQQVPQIDTDNPVNSDGSINIKEQKLVVPYKATFKAFDTYNEIVAESMSDVSEDYAYMPVQLGSNIDIPACTVGTDTCVSPSSTTVFNDILFYRTSQPYMSYYVYMNSAVQNVKLVYTFTTLNGKSYTASHTYIAAQILRADVDLSTIMPERLCKATLVVENNSPFDYTINAYSVALRSTQIGTAAPLIL